MYLYNYMKRLICIPLFISVISVLYPLQSERDLFREAENRFLGGDYVLALSLYNQFLEEYPLSEFVPDIQFRKALSLYRTGLTEEAFDLLLRIEQRYRSTRFFPLVPFWKGLIRYEGGDYAEAVEFFNAFLRRGADTLREETLLYLGIAAEKLGRFEEAREHLSRLLETRPPETEQYGFTLLCSILVKTGEDGEALRLIEGTDPEKFRPGLKERLILYRAEALWNTGETLQAVEQYRAILKAEPEISAVAFQRLFTHIRRSGSDDELQDILDRAEMALAGKLDVLTGFWLRIGTESFKEGRFETAKIYLQRIWNAVDPSKIDPLVPLYLSQLYTLEGLPAKGIDVLEEYRNTGAPENEYILFQLSGLYLTREGFPETLQTCSDFLHLFPGSEHSGEISYRLAYALYRQGQLEGVLETVRAALSGGASKEERSKLLSLSAAVHRKLGQDGPARELLEEYIALNPSDVDAVIRIAKIAFKQREYSAVIERTAGAVELAGKQGVLARYLAGLSMIPGRRYAEAMSLLDGITPAAAAEAGLEDVYPYAIFYRGWVRYRLAEFGEALEEFTALTDSYPSFALTPEALYLAGWCSYSLGDYGRARSFFGRYTGRAPEDQRDRGTYMHAKSYAAAGSIQEAAAILRQLYTGPPGSAFADDALFEHAGILEKAENFKEAAELYGELYDKYPDSPFGEESLFRRAEVLYRQKKWYEARSAFYNVRSAYPEGSLQDAAFYWGGMASLEAGEPFGAVLLWEKLIREFKESTFRPDAMYKTAEVYRSSGDYSKAFALFSELLSAYPKDGRAASADRAAEELMYLLQGQEEREADLMVTINRSGGATAPDGREAMIELARLYLYRGGSDREKVPELLSKIIQRKDEDLERAARAQYYIGEYYYRKNDLTRAWKEFLAAATMNPEDKDLMAMSLFRALQVALAAGRTDEARKLSGRLKDHFPESSWAIEAEHLLEER